MASQPALFFATSGDIKALVLDKLHDQSYHVFFWQKSEGLVGKATVPRQCYRMCQIHKYGICEEQWIDNELDKCVDRPFQYLIGDTKKSEDSFLGSLWVLGW